MLLASQIADKTFRRSLFGYEMEQVDAFLDEIIIEMQRLYDERDQMLARIDALQDAINDEQNSLLQLNEPYANQFR
jgi:DivIVA domain-containing protein